MNLIKYILPVILQLSFSNSPFGVFNRKYPSHKPGAHESNVIWVKQVSQQKSPDSWNLLEQYDKLPQKQEVKLRDGLTITVQKSVKTFNYLNGNNKTELLLAMSTNVHEISHAFFRNNTLKYAKDRNMQLNWDNAEGFIYLSPSQSFFISIPRKILFPSRKLASVIPLRMKTFRYDTYIKGNSSTQDEGIVGLLNEFHAYYLGSKYTFDMLDAYKTAEGNAKGIHFWVSHSQSTMSAFYEFDYFMREYLLYMKEKSPADYEKIKNNENFRNAYGSLRSLYSNLVSSYEETVYSQMKLLNKTNDAEAVLEQKVLWITPKDSKMRMGTSIFSEDKEKILALLNTNRYQSIEKDFLQE